VGEVEFWWWASFRESRFTGLDSHGGCGQASGATAKGARDEQTDFALLVRSDPRKYRVLGRRHIGPRTVFADSGYAISYVRATPKRGTHLLVGDHIALSVTVAYKLTVTDKGKIAIVVQKGDNSPLTPGRNQVMTEVSRGSGEITLTDEFDVPAGTSLVRVFIPLHLRGTRIRQAKLLSNTQSKNGKAAKR